jgi:hypothetical protein
MLFAASVSNLERSSATTAAQESRQQCGPVSHCAIRTPHVCIPTGVGADLLLIAHKLLPRNIPFVVIRNGNFPLLQRASVATRLACAAIDNGSASVISSPNEDASIGWVF